MWGGRTLSALCQRVFLEIRNLLAGPDMFSGVLTTKDINFSVNTNSAFLRGNQLREKKCCAKKLKRLFYSSMVQKSFLLGEIWGSVFIWKRQSNEIFYLQFFSSFKPAWATDQWVKIFSYLVSFSPRYSIFNCEKTDSPGYDTTGSKRKNSILERFCKNTKCSPLMIK